MHYVYLIVNKVNGKTYVGQHKPLSIETRLAMSEGHKGLSSGMKDKHWYTNGVINVVSSERPDEFQRGRV